MLVQDWCRFCKGYAQLNVVKTYLPQIILYLLCIIHPFTLSWQLTQKSSDGEKHRDVVAMGLPESARILDPVGKFCIYTQKYFWMDEKQTLLTQLSATVPRS